MNIILDAMGSDEHPVPELEAAVTAYRLYGEPVTLVGNEEILAPKLAEVNRERVPVTIVHAPEVLEMTDKPVENARHKAQNSMAVGLELVKSGQGHAFVTAGNTGGAMVNALLRLGRLRGVQRPALCGTFPVLHSRCIVIDLGANADCRPDFLAQFAVMGSLYSNRVFGVEKPRVGILSNGEEAGKGNQLVRDAYPLLVASGVNFIGNVEPKDMFAGRADVVVSDGFTGNILLKSSEAAAKLLTTLLKENLKSSMLSKLGAVLAKHSFDELKRVMDPSEYGAAPLLGVDGLVFIGHGRSDAKALVSAIRVARQAVQADLLGALRESLQTTLTRTA